LSGGTFFSAKASGLAGGILNSERVLRIDEIVPLIKIFT
jgi:hypothetical protein